METIPVRLVCLLGAYPAVEVALGHILPSWGYSWLYGLSYSDRHPQGSANSCGVQVCQNEARMEKERSCSITSLLAFPRLAFPSLF